MTKCNIIKNKLDSLNCLNEAIIRELNVKIAAQDSVIFNQLGIILSIWTVGELISSLFSSIITIPGTIMGMIILFLLLQFKILKEDAIKDVTDFLLNNMAIFFVPAGISLIQCLGLIKENVVVLILSATVARLVIMLVTGKTVDIMINKNNDKDEDDTNENEELA